VRITGGEWASRRISGPGRSAALRPTPDALREQAFAILGPHLVGAPFLDLFAGTGVNSLEALSRGASTAVLIERAPRAAALIRRNFAALGVPEGRWELITREARFALAALAERRSGFALAWCDPPFASWEDGPVALALAREFGVLGPGAQVVLEVPPRSVVSLPGFSVERELRGAFLVRAVGNAPSEGE
jgi:16S rRNA (guanine966-N2)-methyltransferase